MASANAEVLNYGTDKDTYRRGEKVTAFITIKNAGTAIIRSVHLNVSIARSVPLLGFVNVYSTEYPLKDLNIPPGESKKVEASERMPEDFHGISTQGKYELKIKVMIDDREIGSIAKAITIL